MKKVIVHPERCVGCMQCMAACAAAHSRSKSVHGAVLEFPIPKPRIHVGSGIYGEGFPNRCRHCDPAPCMLACLPGAIYRDDSMETVLIDPFRCINCASCAMACPFGVIRYHEDRAAPPGKCIAVKCDNCLERQLQGLIPACAEVCKSGALRFEEPAADLKDKTDEIARRISLGAVEGDFAHAPALALLNAFKRAQREVNERRP
ncbi:MAG: 4Fe-4S dicluster domain-containing protein [Deltaproteobacteria bacterium]|nr:4Fe-4S dicluster domain-containing protein [Deltaproteobacteria bacterium]